MTGGEFQGSNDGSAYTTLYTISTQPAYDQWTTVSLSVDPASYRYLRYLSPDNGFGNVAEVQFYSVSSTTPLSGVPFGTPGCWNNSGNTYNKVFDGDTTTFFDAVNGDGDFAGIDRGTAGGTPIALTAMGTNGAVDLSWPQSIGASGYSVYRGTSAGAESTTPLATGLTSGSYVDSSVTAGATYYYVVTAVAGGVEGAESNEASAASVVDPTTTGATPLFAVNSGGSSSGRFSADEDYSGGYVWAPNPAVDTSAVSNPAPQAVYGSERYGANTYTFSGLTAGNEYLVRLHFAEISLTAAGQRVFSVTIDGMPVLNNFDIVAAAGAPDKAIVESFTVPANSSGQIVVNYIPIINDPKSSGIEIYADAGSSTAPAAITGLQAAGTTTGINLTWNGFAGACTYNIYRSTTAGGEGAAPIATGLSADAYTDTSTSTNQVYYYEVTGVTAGGEGAKSNEASAEMAIDPSVSGLSPVIAVNSGGGAAGRFSADEDYSGGNVWAPNPTVDTSAVSDPAPQAVYGSERYGVNTYTFGGLVANTSYLVRLHFAEISLTAAGQRVFNVAINGVPVLNNFDIVAATGAPDKAIVESFTIPASSSGQIAIAYTPVVNDPKSSGIELYGTTTANEGPSTPTGLTATAGNAQVALSWTASTNAASYNLYRGTTAGGELATPYQTGLSGVTYTDASVTNGTTYYYTVAAVGEGITTGYSNEASATPQPPTPTITSFTPSSGPVGTTVNIVGTNLTGCTVVTFYGGATAAPTVVSSTFATVVVPTGALTGTFAVTDVGVSGSSPSAFTVIPLPTITSFTPASGPGGTVVTIHGTNLGDASSVSFGGTPATSFSIYLPLIGSASTNPTILATVPAGIPTVAIVVTTPNGAAVSPTNFNPTAPPSAPTLTASGSTSPLQASLSWTASTGATGYNVYRGTTSGGESPIPLATDLSGTSYTDSSVTINVAYYYKVTALDGTTEGSRSNEAAAQPGGPPAPPTPNALVAQPDASSATAIQLRCNFISGVSIFNIYRGTSPGAEATTPVASNVSLPAYPTLYTDSGLSAGATYYYEVTSVSDGVESGRSNEASAVAGGTQLAAPTITSCTTSAGEVELGWSSVSGASGYLVSRTQGLTYNFQSWIEPASPTTLTDTSVNAGSEYTYTVTAVGSAGVGIASSPAAILVEPCAPPTDLIATLSPAFQPNSVLLTWTPPPGTSIYYVYRGTTPGGEGSSPYYYSLQPNFEMNAPAPGSTYYCQVAAFYAVQSGEHDIVGPRSAEVAVTVPESVTSGFQMIAAPQDTSIATSSKSEVVISAQGASDFSGLVNLTVSGAPTGVAAWCYGPSFTIDPTTHYGEGTDLWLVVSSSAAPGTYPITITGTAASSASYACSYALTVNLTIP